MGVDTVCKIICHLLLLINISVLAVSDITYNEKCLLISVAW